jgi:P pilus assembly chaperone PapD
MATLLPASAHAQISVDELELFLRSDSGAATGVVQVTNETDRPVQVLVEMQDWRRDPNGINEFFAFQTLPRSCGARLQAFPTSLRLGPRETQPVRVAFQGPPASACWNVVFLQASEPQAAGGRSQITYVIRTGVKVYVESSQATRDGDVESVRMLPDSAGVRRVEITFRNLGAAHVKPRGAVEIRRADNSQAGRVELPEFPLEPESLRRIVVPLPSLAPGQYVLLALLDFGGAAIAAGQLELLVR